MDSSATLDAKQRLNRPVNVSFAPNKSTNVCKMASCIYL
jgi:hypothetical protein